MGSIGQIRAAHRYGFPLLGITLEKLVTWPNGPRSKRFLWWREERWPLALGYSHFLLAPGEKFGEDSPWLAEAASCLSRGHKSVTVLANGGGVARKDVALSMEMGRPVIVLAGTGRLADAMANEANKSALVTTVQAINAPVLREALHSQFEIPRHTSKQKEAG
jgi:hypothetical protein